MKDKCEILIQRLSKLGLAEHTASVVAMDWSQGTLPYDVAELIEYGIPPNIINFVIEEIELIENVNRTISKEKRWQIRRHLLWKG